MIVSFAIIILGVLFIQLVVGYLVGRLYKSIKITAIELTEAQENQIASIHKESVDLNTIEEKRKKLGFITIIVSLIEMAFFMLLTIFFLNHYGFKFFEIVPEFSKFLVGWIAIKVIGNYGQWSGPILGRATYYTFLIGTFLNIMLATFLAFMLFKLQSFFIGLI